MTLAHRKEVLVQASWTNYHRPGGLKNRHLLLRVLEAEAPAGTGAVLREGSLPGYVLTGLFLANVCKERLVFLPLFKMALILP